MNKKNQQSVQDEYTEEDILELLDCDPSVAIRILTSRYGGLIYSITYRRLHGVLVNEDIEECVSDIFLDFYRSRDRIDLTKGSIKSFLLIIAKRQSIKYFERKEHKDEHDSLEGREVCFDAGEKSLEDHFIEKEQSQMVLQNINALGEPNATIVKCKYYYGMTAKEIGKKLGFTKNAVEKRLKRSLEHLKKQLSLQDMEETYDREKK